MAAPRFSRVLITGASSGLGRQLALDYAAPGVCVGLLARRVEALEELAGALLEGGAEAVVLQANVCDAASLLRAATRFATQAGPPDLLVLNAGLGAVGAGDFDPEGELHRLEVNLMGSLRCLHAWLPAMLERGAGTVAVVSSLAAQRALPGSVGYSASKAGLEQYVRGLRLQLRGRGVRFVLLRPGYVRTPMLERPGARLRPFVVPLELASRQMRMAIARGDGLYSFPWQTSLMAQALRWLPEWALVALLRRRGRSLLG